MKKFLTVLLAAMLIIPTAFVSVFAADPETPPVEESETSSENPPETPPCDHHYVEEKIGRFVKHTCTVCKDYYYTDDKNIEADRILVSHKNTYDWNAFETTVTDWGGYTYTETLKYNGAKNKTTEGVVYEVENYGDVYQATVFHEKGDDANNAITPYGGFLLVITDNDEAFTEYGHGELVGYDLLPVGDLMSEETGAFNIDTGMSTDNCRHIKVLPPEGKEIVKPVVSLGAKVPTDGSKSIRFGARYNKIPESLTVSELGMLLIPKERLERKPLEDPNHKGDKLEHHPLDYPERLYPIKGRDEYIVNCQASGIEELKYGKNEDGDMIPLKFEDYDTFTFYCTVINLDGFEDKEILARPFIRYSDGTTRYANSIIDSYNYAKEKAQK